MRALMTAVALLAASCTWAGQSASQDANATNGNCGARDVYKFDGWQIPGLAGAVPQGELLADADVPGVSIREMKPGKTDEPLVIIGCASKAAGGGIDYKALPVVVMQMWRYEFGGKVFAYSVVYPLWHIFKGKRVPLAGYAAVGFYDMDGDGLFTIMRYEEAETMVRDVEVPKWANRPADSRGR